MQNDELNKMLETLSGWAVRHKRGTHIVPEICALNEQRLVGASIAGPRPETPRVPAAESLLSQAVREVSTYTPLQSALSSSVYHGIPEQPVVSQTGPANSDSSQAPARQQTDEIGRLNAQLDQLRRVAVTQAEAIAENTKALASSQSKTQTQTNGQSTGGRILSTILGTGLGMGSLISGIVGLFGNRSVSTPTVLTKYELPPSVQMENGVSHSGNLVPVQYSQSGVPRVDSAAARQQVTIQIQALDSRSVLDRSDDIARAVREAMLHSHSLNDVVSDL